MYTSRFTLTVTLATWFLVVTGPVPAATSGVDAQVAALTCPNPSFCGGPGSQFASDDPPFSPGPSTLAVLNSPIGNGRASASLSGVSLLPIIRAEAFSNANSTVQSIAVGVREYQHIGFFPQNLALTVNLDGAIVDVGDPGDPFVDVHVAVIAGPQLFFTPSWPTLAFEVVPDDPALSFLAQSANLTVPANSGTQTVSQNLSFTVFPGNRIFVWAAINIQATRGDSIDYFSTLTMNFADPDTFAPINPDYLQAVIVPLPAGVVLLPAAAFALLRRRRRCA